VSVVVVSVGGGGGGGGGHGKKDDCKKGGWMHMTRADGSSFKNQGDCIQWVNTGK
jgi:hypothetical protein